MHTDRESAAALASEGRLDTAQRCFITLGFPSVILVSALVPHVAGDTLPWTSEVAQLGMFILLSIAFCGLGHCRLLSFKLRISNVHIRNHLLYTRLRELTLKANYDGLTGFPNERLLADRFGEALARVKRQKSTLLLYRITLADMDVIIQQHGGAIASQIILELGNRLGGVLRGTDSIVRLKNSDYVLILESVNSPEKLHRVTLKIKRVLSADFVVEGQGAFSAQGKVAMARYPQDGHTLDALMSASNARMTRAIALTPSREIVVREYADVSPSQFNLLMTTFAQ